MCRLRIPLPHADGLGEKFLWAIKKYGYFDKICVFLYLVHSNVFTKDSTLECPKCKELVEIGIIYKGYGIGVISNVGSWSECKKCCTEKWKCNFLTHYSSQSKCHLKTSDKDRTNVTQATSGTRGCKTEATADFTQNNLCGFKAQKQDGVDR